MSVKDEDTGGTGAAAAAAAAFVAEGLGSRRPSGKWAIRLKFILLSTPVSI